MQFHKLHILIRIILSQSGKILLPMSNQEIKKSKNFKISLKRNKKNVQIKTKYWVFCNKD